jgi:hypothetical protein
MDSGGHVNAGISAKSLLSFLPSEKINQGSSSNAFTEMVSESYGSIKPDGFCSFTVT